MNRFLLVFMVVSFFIVSCSDNKKDVVTDVDETTDKIIDEDETVDTVIDEDVGTQDFVPVDDDETVDIIADEDEQVDDDIYVNPCSSTQCLIDEVCIDDKTTDIANGCQECDISKNLFSWSFKSAEFVCGTVVGDCEVAAKCSGDSAVCPANTDSDLLCDSLEHKVCITSNCACDSDNGYHAGTDGTCCIDECETVGITCLDGVLSECEEVNGCKIKTDSDCVTGACEDDSTCEPDCTEGQTQVITCATEPSEFQKQTCSALEVWEDDGVCYSVIMGDMVLIPGGTFQMGSPTDELGRDSDEAIHTVTLTISFYMNKYEVTQGEFSSVMGYNPSYFPECGDDCPVEQVNWREALAYANERSRLEGFEECFDCIGSGTTVICSLKSTFVKPQDCKGYRLPTESEWEYVARANTTTAFYSGEITQRGRDPLDPNLDLIGWYGGNSTVTYEGGYNCSSWFTGADKCGTQPVGGKQVNTYGLFDMSGNVWEWNMDWYSSTYPVGPVTDPTGAKVGSLRVFRGGSWGSYADLCRSASRGYNTPTYRGYILGFRLSRTE